MPLLSFENLVERFGEIMAWHCLAEIEKAAGLSDRSICQGDPETRFTRACQIQDSAPKATPVSRALQ
ncbi:MAG: hypothetical protein ABTQ34_07795 [Bdellovibrionales bacterium]